MSIIQRESQPVSDSKQKAMLTVICKIANIYNQTLNALQKLYGLQLRQGGCSKAAVETFNKLHDCVSYPTTLANLDQFAKEADDALRSFTDCEVTQVGDNIDIRIKVRHELSGVSYRDLHLYNNMMYKTRIPTQHLSDVPPVPPDSISCLDFGKFLPSLQDQQQLINRLVPLVAEVWSNVEVISKLASDLSVIPPHEFSAEMKLKSEKVRSYHLHRQVV